MAEASLPLPHAEPAGRQDSLRKTVFLLALPAVGEQVLNTLVGIVDHFLVGHLSPEASVLLGYDRATALASVGLANMLVWLTMTLFMAVSVGATAVVARRIGERDDEAAGHALQQGLFLAVVVAIIGSLLCWFGGEAAMRLLGATPEVAATGNGFLRIITLSFLPAALMFATTAALRGAGDTRTPLYVMAVVNVINMALAWLLVNGQFGLPTLGVEGTAIGASVGRTVGAALLLAFLFRGKLRLKLPAGWRLDRAVLMRIVRIGMPTAGEQFIFQSAILLMTGFITALGTAAYAAHTVTINIESLSFLPGFGFAVAATALVGQSLGANDPERAEAASWEALKQGSVMMVAIGLPMALWPATITGWIAPDPAVIEQATWPLRLAGAGQIFLAFSFILIGALRGAGDTTWPLWMRVFSTWIVRVPLALLLLRVTDWGLFALWLAMFTDFAVQGLLAFWRFRSGKWKAIKV